MFMWIPLKDLEPEPDEIVVAYRDSPEDAEAMMYRGGVFIDLHGNAWTNVSHWRR